MQTWQCEADQKRKCQERAATRDAYTKPRMTARRFLEWIRMFERPGWSCRYEISELFHQKTFCMDRLARLLSGDRLVYGQHYALCLDLGTANKGWNSKTYYSKASAKRARNTTMIRDPVGIQTQDGSCEIISHALSTSSEVICFQTTGLCCTLPLLLQTVILVSLIAVHLF